MKLSYNSIFLKFTVFFSQKKSVKIITGINILLKKILPLKIILDKEDLFYTKESLKQAKYLRNGMRGFIILKMMCQKLKRSFKWIKNHKPNLTGTPFAYEYKDKKESKK